jgi:hypothetical protein
MSNDIGSPLNIAYTGQVGFVSILSIFPWTVRQDRLTSSFFYFQTLSTPAAPHQRFCAMGKSVLILSIHLKIPSKLFHSEVCD